MFNVYSLMDQCREVSFSDTLLANFTIKQSFYIYLKNYTVSIFYDYLK